MSTAAADAGVPGGRRAGLLVHPVSFPGRFGMGDLGEGTHAFLDFAQRAGVRCWQVMPLGPTGFGDSPYQAFSAFAGNPWLIALQPLQQAGWLHDEELAGEEALPSDRIDYGATIRFRAAALDAAAARFHEAAGAHDREALQAFREREQDWLHDFVTFMALKECHDGRPWNEWPAALRDRDSDALTAFRRERAFDLLRHELRQFWFDEQWRAVRSKARALDVQILGDLPIFVAYDSADVWSAPDLYHLNEHGQPTVVAGVPPDYFSATGQRWGNPLYRWDAMQASGFAWWIRRVQAALTQTDLVRIDHFRGFESYWEIPAHEPTAVQGRWVEGPGQTLFDAFRGAFGERPAIVAEDLGVITPEVEALRDRNGLPGMAVLQFAFGGDANDPYLPHRHLRNQVVYTGTHDNDTTAGWYAALGDAERDRVRRYLGRSDAEVPWALLRAAYGSVADLAVVPLQDALQLGSEARMNVPGRPQGNWSWRCAWSDLSDDLAARLRDLSDTFGRLESGPPQDTAYRQSHL